MTDRVVWVTVLVPTVASYHTLETCLVRKAGVRFGGTVRVPTLESAVVKLGFTICSKCKMRDDATARKHSRAARHKWYEEAPSS